MISTLVKPLKLKGVIALAVVSACGIAGLSSASPMWIAAAAILLACDAWPRLREARSLRLTSDAEEQASIFAWTMHANVVIEHFLLWRLAPRYHREDRTLTIERSATHTTES